MLAIRHAVKLQHRNPTLSSHGDGALEVVKSLPDPLPRRIVYVSCNPATLARDAAVLVNVRGYRLAAAGVINMFPHTSHVESMAVFEAS